MLLGDYFHNIKNNHKKFFFSDISFNSNQIKKDNIFFAIKGNKIDGNNFILSAIKNGAKIIVTEKKKYGLKNGILFIQSTNIRKLLRISSITPTFGPLISFDGIIIFKGKFSILAFIRSFLTVSRLAFNHS